MTTNTPTPQTPTTLTIKHLAVILSILAIVAVTIAFVGGFTQASAQTREPATRAPIEEVAEADTEEAADAADNGADAADDAATHREPATRPSGADEAATDEATVNDAVASPASGAVEALPGDYDDTYDEFYECSDELWNNLDEPTTDEEWEAAIEAIEAQIIEQCLPLLPADEQAIYQAEQAYGECQNEIYDALYEGGEEITEEDYEAAHQQALDQCLSLLPADQQAEILAWENYGNCIDEQVGLDASHIDSLTAQRDCLSELPEELRAEQEMYLDFEICLADNGAYDGAPWHADGAGSVNISTMEMFEELILGDEPATITITSDGSSVTIETEGDVVVFDHEAYYEVQDQAYETCADLNPYGDDMYFEGDFEVEGPAMPVPISRGLAMAGN